MHISNNRLAFTSICVWSAFITSCSAAPEFEEIASTSEALVVDLTPLPSASGDVSDQRRRTNIGNINDGSEATKILYKHQDFWIEYRMAAPSIAKSYKISRSQEDWPDRVPTQWKLMGSKEGIVWVELDSQQNQELTLPAASYSLSSNTTPYLYYRLYVEDNHTDKNGDTELSEFRIEGEVQAGTIPGAVPSVTATATGSSIRVSWSAASNATGYLVQRIGDDGTSVVETAVTGLAYTDSNLAPGTMYVYQIQPVNGDRRGRINGRARATTAGVARTPSLVRDVTALTAAVPTDEYGKTGANDPENIFKVTDNDPYTKYYQPDGTTWIRQQVPSGSVITQYSLTSANDYPERDPRRWTLQGSNDGTNWKTIDTRDKQAFLTRHQTRTFTCNPDGLAFTHFKLTILETQGAGDTQLAEWRLLGSSSTGLGAPNAPSNLAIEQFSYSDYPGDDNAPKITGQVVSGNQVGLTFVDNAGKQNAESGFVLERATNSAFTANLVTRTIGPNSDGVRALGLAPNTTYYFQVKAINVRPDGGVNASAPSPYVTVTTTNGQAPPNPWQENGWYGHWDRDLWLAQTDATNKVRIYYDQSAELNSISWLTPLMGAVWSRVNQKYGSLSDPYLNVIANDGENGRCCGGGAVNLWDPRGGFRNAPWAAARTDSQWDWTSLNWNDGESTIKVDFLVHEIAHIVEAVSMKDQFEGRPNLWEDSWWGVVFQYDMFKSLSVFPQVFRDRFKNEWLGKQGDNGAFWFRDWYRKLYDGEFGNTADANKGVNFLVKYLDLQAQYLPKRGRTYAPRPFTFGDYVHFCAGAAGVDLVDEAKAAFNWTHVEELQLARAQAEFPEVTRLYRGNQAPAFTFNPTIRKGLLNVALSGQTLAGSAADPDPNDTLTYSKGSGTWPSWLGLASNGALTGTPNTPGTVTANVVVTDPSGLSATATLTFEVASPCAGLCSNPSTFSGLGFQTLGTSAVCRQTTAPVETMRCGNVTSPRVLRVNGVQATCNGSWFAAPAKRNGGYCFNATSGNQSSAYFDTL